MHATCYCGFRDESGGSIDSSYVAMGLWGCSLEELKNHEKPGEKKVKAKSREGLRSIAETMGQLASEAMELCQTCSSFKMLF